MAVLRADLVVELAIALALQGELVAAGRQRRTPRRDRCRAGFPASASSAGWASNRTPSESRRPTYSTPKASKKLDPGQVGRGARHPAGGDRDLGQLAGVVVGPGHDVVAGGRAGVGELGQKPALVLVVVDLLGGPVGHLAQALEGVVDAGGGPRRVGHGVAQAVGVVGVADIHRNAGSTQPYVDEMLAGFT